MNDPIIEEIRRIRDEHSRLFDYDLDAICEDYKLRQNDIKNRLVRLKPRLIAANHTIHTDWNSSTFHAGR